MVTLRNYEYKAEIQTKYLLLEGFLKLNVFTLTIKLTASISLYRNSNVLVGQSVVYFMGSFSYDLSALLRRF